MLIIETWNNIENINFTYMFFIPQKFHSVWNIKYLIIKDEGTKTQRLTRSTQQ